MRITVFTWGNPSRGDDGVGPWFADWMRQTTQPNTTLVEDFQLQVEHVLDCQDGDLLLFIDAGCHPGRDVQFEEVAATADIAHTSHALTPAELLGHYRRVFKTLPPPAFQLTIVGSSFELGQPMSAATEAQCQRATELVTKLLSKPSAGSWRSLAGSLSARCHA